ncbi:MAG: hypothetical protein ACR2NA_01965, partial [Solirubrobacterales bacterium]
PLGRRLLCTRLRYRWADGSTAGDDGLTQADSPPGPPAPAGPGSPWAGVVAEHLALGGAERLGTAYPSGRHTVDIGLQARGRSLGIECDVHPGGPEAHIERHLALRRAGWDLAGAHRSRWADRPGQLAVHLLDAIRDPSAR